MSKSDIINHPPHYTFGEKFEVIDVIDNWAISFGFCVGSAIKYIARAEHKGNRIEDLEKATWYINHLLECMKAPDIPFVRIPISEDEIISDVDVIKDWNLDKHEGLAIQQLRQVTDFCFRYASWDKAISYLTLARNQVALAIGKLTT